jgi:hypothetical protein
LVGRTGARDRPHGPAREHGPCRDGATAHTPVVTGCYPTATLLGRARSCRRMDTWGIVTGGGRPLDHGRATMDVLPEVLAAVAGRAGSSSAGDSCAAATS